MTDGLIREELDVLQTDVDDESPQVLGSLIERALIEGALDAHLAPLTMKKNRPGIRVEILCKPQDRERFVRLLLTETGTLGVKVRRIDRYSMPRRIEEIIVGGCTVHVKVAVLDGIAIRAVPEYEDCRAVAAEQGRPLRDVLAEATAIARRFLEPR